MSLEKQRSPRFDRFEQAVADRLTGEGWLPVDDRFLLAGEELGKLGFRALYRARGGRSFVVSITRGDALAQEQLRYLSDQYYNALNRELNEIRDRPTRVRGVCIFAYERSPEQKVVGFLMDRVRPRNLFAPIRSLPWVLDLEGRRLQRPRFTRAPFPESLLWECADRTAQAP